MEGFETDRRQGFDDVMRRVMRGRKERWRSRYRYIYFPDQLWKREEIFGSWEDRRQWDKLGEEGRE